MIELANLKKRIISAAILIPLVLFAVALGGFVFNLLVAIFALSLFYEAFLILKKQKKLALLEKHIGYLLAYIAIPSACLISLRNSAGGVDALIFSLALVWITDIAGFFGGKHFGGPKLAEKISPNKTISGAVSGLIACILVAAVTFLFTNNISFLGFIAIALVISIFAQLGDLFESFLKRKLAIKDSGNLIPGHGGLFDRVDGLLFALPIAYLIFSLTYSNIF